MARNGECECGDRTEETASDQGGAGNRQDDARTGRGTVARQKVDHLEHQVHNQGTGRSVYV